MTCQECRGAKEVCVNVRCYKTELDCTCKRPAIAECKYCKGSGVELDDPFPSPAAHYGYNANRPLRNPMDSLGDI